MAYIRDWVTVEDAANVLITTGALPTHEIGDLLLWILSKDDALGGGYSTSSPGWMVLDRQTGNAALGSAVIWKFASSSNETRPMASSSDTDAHHTVMLSIADAHPTLPFNATASTANVAASQFSSPSVTTTVNDCLMIWAISADGAVTSPLSNPGAHHLMSQDAATISTAVAWGFQKLSGSTPTITWTQSLSEETNRLTLAIRNSTNGRIPAYVDRSINPARVITPLHHFSTLNNIQFPATLNLPTIGNKTTVFDAAAATADFGINPYSSAISSTPLQAAATFQNGFKLLYTTAININSGTIGCSFGVATPRDALTDVGKTSETGTLITFVDSENPNTQYTAYHIAASDSNPNYVGRAIFVINPRQTTTAEVISGTLNTGQITGTVFTTAVPRGATSLYYSELHHIDKLVVAGGDINHPVDVEGLYSVGNSYRLPVIQQTGASALISYTPIQIGGGDEIYCSLENSALQFPRIFDKSTKQLSYHANPRDIGISYYGRTSSDVIKHINSIVTSPSEFYWDIHASASSSASYDFSGLSIIGAAVNLKNVTTFSGMSFIGCTVITASNCILDECTITNVPISGNSILVNSSSLIQNCLINVSRVSASLSWCQTNNPSIFNNTSFVNTASAGHALTMTQSGTFTFTGNTFTGFGASGTVNAALYNNSSGSITLNIINGDVPTYRDGFGAITIINNTKTLTLTGLIADSEIRIFRVSDNVELGGTESSLTTFEHNYNYVSDVVVDIIIMHLNYDYLRISSITLGANGLTIPVQQRVDRVYNNP